MSQLLEPSPAYSQGDAQSDKLHLLAVGDILLGKVAKPYLKEQGYDYPFRQVKPYFDADLIVGNLEAPLTRYQIPLSSDKPYTYKAHPKAAKALKEFGFNLFCLANNHILDYGMTGLADTQKYLDEQGIRHFGAGLSYEEAIAGQVIELKGVRLGFLGFMQRYNRYCDYDYFAAPGKPGVAPMQRETVWEAMRALRPQVDLLIVSFHWGRNYQPVTPTQIEWGKRAVDYGADLVLGHHPHVGQGVEVYQGVPIVYSLGNFTFGSRGRFDRLDPLWHYSWIADIAIEHGQITHLDLIPIEVNNTIVNFQPRIAAPHVLPELAQMHHQDFNSSLEVLGDRLRLHVATASASQS